jgi:hypothetical protein
MKTTRLIKSRRNFVKTGPSQYDISSSMRLFSSPNPLNHARQHSRIGCFIAEA